MIYAILAGPKVVKKSSDEDELVRYRAAFPAKERQELIIVEKPHPAWPFREIAGRYKEESEPK